SQTSSDCNSWCRDSPYFAEGCASRRGLDATKRAKLPYSLAGSVFLSLRAPGLVQVPRRVRSRVLKGSVCLRQIGRLLVYGDASSLHPGFLLHPAVALSDYRLREYPRGERSLHVLPAQMHRAWGPQEDNERLARWSGSTFRWERSPWQHFPSPTVAQSN